LNFPSFSFGERTFQTDPAGRCHRSEASRRRAKLHYLRGRTGKSARIKEKLLAKKAS